MMPNTDQVFRLNWASFSSGEKRADTGSDLSIFIGDLAPDVTDGLLYETFAGRYPSVKSAKVVFDTNTGCSKGYGFVRFGDEGERTRAMTEMNGQYCSSRPMRVGVATPKKPPTQQQYGQQQFPSQGMQLFNSVFFKTLDYCCHNTNFIIIEVLNHLNRKCVFMTQVDIFICIKICLLICFFIRLSHIFCDRHSIYYLFGRLCVP